MSLWSDFLSNTDRKTHKYNHYFLAYERFLAPYVNRRCVMWEIGVDQGGSLQLWKKALGPLVQVVGIDIQESCAALEEPQIAVRIGSQADTAFLQEVLDEFGPPDIVLDDGSHIQEHLRKTFGYVFPRMAPQSVYIAEDLHTCYWEQYGGGLHVRGSFIEYLKDLIDDLNGGMGGESLPPTPFTHSALSMTFYNSLVAIERCPHPYMQAIITGSEARGAH